MPDQNELLVTSFDSIGGKREQLLRIPVEPGAGYHWALSPDGSRIGMLKTDWKTTTIRFFHLADGTTRTVTVKNYVNLHSLDWAPDSNSLFVSSAGPGGARLLHIDLDGNAYPIWQARETLQTWGVPSPDGRHLAMVGRSEDANLWMIDDF